MTNNTAHYERADQLKKVLVGSLKSINHNAVNCSYRAQQKSGTLSNYTKGAGYVVLSKTGVCRLFFYFQEAVTADDGLSFGNIDFTDCTIDW